MTWNKGLALTTANKLFEKYGVSIAQDPNTKIYTAIKGKSSIQHTSVTAITEAVLANWFEVKE
jgi:hypothetical protein